MTAVRPPMIASENDIGTTVNILLSPGSVPDRTREYEVTGFRSSRETGKSFAEYQIRLSNSKVTAEDLAEYWVPIFDVTPAIDRFMTGAEFRAAGGVLNPIGPSPCAICDGPHTERECVHTDTADVAAPEVTEFDTTSGVLTLTIAGMSADFVEVSRLLDVLSGTSEHGREWWRFVLLEKLDAHHLNEPQETA